MNPFFSIKQQARTAEIYIYGELTEYPYRPGETSAASLVNQIKDLDVDVIHVHIDSCGGSVPEGWGIYNALCNHPAKITTHGDGFVASAALYPFLAGDERIASSVSGYYLHEVMTIGFGYADDLRAAADEADALTGIGVNAFTERAGMSEEVVRQLMEDETWLTPEQALEYGIATQVVTQKQTAEKQQSAKKVILARLTAQQKQKTPEPPAKPNMMQTMAKAMAVK